MRVALYFGRPEPEGGGGYSFATEVRRGLSAAGRGRHELIVFGWEPERPSELQDVHFVSIGRSLWRRGGSRVSAHASGLWSRIWRSAPEPRHWLDRLLEGHGIEAVCNVVPFEDLSENFPYVSVVWDLQHRRQPVFPEVGLMEEWARRERYYSRVLRRAAFVVTGTAAGKAEVQLFYQVPEERIRTLPHPTPVFPEGGGDAGVPGRYGLPPGYLFYPAQFWPHKNHVGLLMGLRLLRERHGLTLPLALAGSDAGNAGHVREKVRTWDLEGQVHFLGFVPRPDLVGLYRGASALAYVSFFGPENLPPLEAFALGCPVVAARVAGAEEQLGDAAVLVDPASPEEIAEALRAVHTDAALRGRLVAQGKARAARFTGRDFAAGLVGIFDELESRRRCWPSPPRSSR
jgi:glycosyltransferase involved in cell wall biosynthesis